MKVTLVITLIITMYDILRDWLRLSDLVTKLDNENAPRPTGSNAQDTRR